MTELGEAEKPAKQQVRGARRVLVVDDDKLQLKLSTIRLRDAGFVVETASSAKEALRLALATPPDVILSDVLMGEIDGFGLCRRLREQPALSTVPVVLASSHYSDPQAQSLATRVGASFLVGRTPDFDAELAALNQVLATPSAQIATVGADVYEQHLRTNADQLSRLLGEAKNAEGRYRALFQSANDTIAVLSRSGVILEANERWRQVLGIEPNGLIGRHLLEHAATSRDSSAAELQAAIETGSGRLYGVAVQRPDGAIIYMDFSISSVEIESRPLVFAIGRDVTGRFLAAQALGIAEEKYRSLVERLPDVVVTLREERFVFVTNNVESLTGLAAADMYAMSIDDWLERIHPSDEESFVAAFERRPVPGKARLFDIEYRWRRRDDRWIWIRHRRVAVYERGDVVYADGLLSDVTERKKLEESLRQAQKMEAIGQLTGGIAHDFNNILATILANSQFLLDALGQHDARLADAQEIKLAAERAAGLTRQLLAFSRRQVLELRVTDLNQIISNLERMLRRLIGEDVEFQVHLSPKLGHVHVDPGQIEQVLLNLAVNARDAMPQGGTLTIETSNTEIDEDYRTTHGAPRAGQYVVIAVSDTGIGMNEETQRRIFEPFFTTKEPGKGTGLGLATTHGIVTQCGGQISVYSELGRGTVFKVYLPQVDEPLASKAVSATESTHAGRELVLLVEDDPPLRSAVQRMLSGRGYRVLSARDGREAVELARANADDLSLLLTDVIMPQVSGPAVAEAIREHVPKIKVLYMSGYTDHAVLAGGVLNREHHFIQKPFAAAALALKVRQTLES